MTNGGKKHFVIKETNMDAGLFPGCSSPLSFDGRTGGCFGCAV